MSDAAVIESGAYDVEAVRSEFPILSSEMNGRPLVFLDTAASAQKPKAVLDAIQRGYVSGYANIHRGIYELSQTATARHDAARRAVQGFLGAEDWREIVFTRNATEAINLVAFSFLEPRLGAGDEILVSELEHHANIVPWQLAAERAGAKVVPGPIDDRGALDLDAFLERIGPRTKMIALAWISNALGTVLPIEAVIERARANSIPVLIDAAQAAQHKPIDVASLGADFLVFSGHKLYGPTGIGVLWGKAERLEEARPYQSGGDMIDVVDFAGTTFADIPFKFEAGTPDIVGAQGLAAAIEFVRSIGLERIEAHEAELYAHADRALRQVPGLRMVGDAPERASALAFVVDWAHPQDVATFLDLDGIAVRTGHHCAMPAQARLGVGPTIRASLGLYTHREDLDALVRSLREIHRRFA